jgi:hypothetical protein
MINPKLALLIQEAAQNQLRERAWIGDLYKQRLKEMQNEDDKSKNQKD